MSDLSQRRGRFTIANRLIEDNPEAIAGVALSGCLVLRAERLWDQDATEYVALHPDFEPVEACIRCPTYTAEVTVERDEKGTISQTRTWVRCP